MTFFFTWCRVNSYLPQFYSSLAPWASAVSVVSPGYDINTTLPLSISSEGVLVS